MSLTIIDAEQEFEFFKLLVICEILNQPKFLVGWLMHKDPKEMYLRAKNQINQNNLQKDLKSQDKQTRKRPASGLLFF